MKLKKYVFLFGLPLLVLGGAGAAAVGRYVYLLQGQAPTRERLLRTATGGKPYYSPIQYRAKDARPAITGPQFAAAEDVHLAGGTKGIAVSINGDNRFYPLFVLQYHQIVNDTCGNKPVVCSY